MRSKQHHTVSCALVANNLQKSHFGQWFVRIGPSGCKRPGLMNRDQNYINEKLNNEWINPSNLWGRDPAVTSVRPHRGGKDCWGGQSSDSQVNSLRKQAKKQQQKHSSQQERKEALVKIYVKYGRCPIRGRAGGLMHYRWFREGQEVICWLHGGQEFIFCFS